MRFDQVWRQSVPDVETQPCGITQARGKHERFCMSMHFGLPSFIYLLCYSDRQSPLSCPHYRCLFVAMWSWHPAGEDKVTEWV